MADKLNSFCIVSFLTNKYFNKQRNISRNLFLTERINKVNILSNWYFMVTIY